jgi:hypothetical protein
LLGFRAREIDNAANLILAGTLKPDPTGMVTLPPGLASATADGKAYVTSPRGGTTTVIVFKVFIGKGSNFVGYIHSATTLPPGLLTFNTFGGGHSVHGIPVTNDTVSIAPLGSAWYHAYSDRD